MKLILGCIAAIALFFMIDAMMGTATTVMHQIVFSVRGGIAALVFTVCLAAIGIMIEQGQIRAELREHRPPPKA